MHPQAHRKGRQTVRFETVVFQTALFCFGIKIKRPGRHHRQIIAVEIHIGLVRIQIGKKLRVNRFGHKLKGSAV